MMTRSKRKTEDLDAPVPPTDNVKVDGQLPTDGTGPAGLEASKPMKKKARFSIQWGEESIVVVELKEAAFKLSSRRLSKESDYFREKFAQGSQLLDESGLPIYVVELDVEISDFSLLLEMLDDAM